jgi:hypothetical protein
MSANRKKTKRGSAAHRAKTAGKTAKSRPSAAKRFVTSNRGWLLLGASAIGLVVATVKRFV